MMPRAGPLALSAAELVLGCNPGRTGILLCVLGVSGMVLAGVIVGVGTLRPAGGGQLVAILRASERDGSLNLSRGVLAIEVLAVAAFALGTLAILVGRFRATREYAVLTPPGLLGTVLVVVGVLLWGLSWVAEGLAFTNSQPWQEP